jgi:hypothetical protein
MNLLDSPSILEIIERFSFTHRLKFNIGKQKLDSIIEKNVREICDRIFLSWKDYYVCFDYIIVNKIKRDCEIHQQESIALISKFIQNKHKISDYSMQTILDFMGNPFDTKV